MRLMMDVCARVCLSVQDTSRLPIAHRTGAASPAIKKAQGREKELKAARAVRVHVHHTPLGATPCSVALVLVHSFATCCLLNGGSNTKQRPKIL